MRPGRFDALVADDSSGSDGDSAIVGRPTPQQQQNNVDIPSFEDLSSSRSDEEMVLMTIYGNDFSKEAGTWGQQKLLVHVRPPGIVEPERIGASLTLSTQIGKNYPYVVPKIDLRDVKGLSKGDQTTLLQQLTDRAMELAASGSVMVCELVQISEDFVLEHNVDPTKSAWEQMKEREAKEQAEQQEMERARGIRIKSLIDNEAEHLSYSRSRGGVGGGSSSGVLSPITDSYTITPRTEYDHDVPSELERELARQREAIKAANRLRMENGRVGNLLRQSSNNDQVNLYGNDDEEEEDDDDFEDDEDEPPAVLAGGSSRYQTDFIELGVLGRGGGGEVVKVRNRLDRRIYAIKKILLESERGKNAKHAKLQNKKLRREVTTISRMMHRNIVRYFQAWMEGGDVEVDAILNDGDGADGDNKNNASMEEEDTANLLKDSLENDSEDFEDDKQGFWSKAPDDDASNSNASSSSSSWSEQGSHSGAPAGLISQGSILESGFDVQGETYKELFKKKSTTGTSSSGEAGDVEDSNQSEGGSVWDESSVKIDSTNKSLSVLYIQMEYCSTTLRKLIDEKDLAKMDHQEVWRLIRQIVEALVYIHGRGIMHRDLKPGNIFLDSSNNVRLGDFGLATKRQEKEEMEISENEEVATIYNAIERVSALLGEDSAVSASRASGFSNAESVTVGVGTTFYRAPEQEQVAKSGDTSYGVKADIFSLGILVFEMFHPPFSTYMERSETLTHLRMDQPIKDQEAGGKLRFPALFATSVPQKAQDLILWCIERDPSKRPSAEELLKSELLPRKIEVEQHYLEEALELLSNPQTEGGMNQIVDALFNRPTPDLVELTFDTDTAVRANNIGSDSRTTSPSDSLIRAIKGIRSNSISSNSIMSMSNLPLVAATASLHRARNDTNVGKGMMKRARMRAAGVLAMTSASSAAVQGNLDGVLGSDPRIVSFVCSRLESIFKSHSAVHLKAPLLRPRHTSSDAGLLGGPAEVLNRRGVPLHLSEDLTASFARAVGRSGSAASNLKRYDIDRVYHKAVAGGHPRETLEATFDIIQDDTSIKVHHFEAEALLSVAQAMVFPENAGRSLPFDAKPPMWYLRLSHTRLADAILEICEIRSDALKKHVLSLFTQLSAPSPASLYGFLNPPRRKRSSSRGSEDMRPSLLRSFIADACENHNLSKTSSERLQLFLKESMPFPPNVDDAISKLKDVLAKLSRQGDSKELLDVDRWYKRFEDAGRIIKHLEALLLTLRTAGMAPLLDSKSSSKDRDVRLGQPLFISLDLGLRQRRRHYHGHLFFQCIAIPSNYYDLAPSDKPETNDTLLSNTGLAIKIAEGGRYDDLVRKARPPGMGLTAFNNYRAAPIPKCVGVRFAVGRLVELMYLESNLAGSSILEVQESGSLEGMEAIRASLGHPLAFMPQPTQCIVTSVHGLNAATVAERFLVASKLWVAGLSAEYLAQSGVLASLLKQQREEAQGPGTSDWNLDELCGVCAIMKIPFVVVIQPHTLRDKGTVRLRSVMHSHNATENYSGNEKIVSLESLPGTILDLSFSDGTEHPHHVSSDQAESSVLTSGSSSNYRNSNRSTEPSIECIYVQNDQFFDSERPVSKEVNNHKSILKTIRGIMQRAEGFVSTIGDPTLTESIPVFAVADLSFWCLRDFGTNLMKKNHDRCSSNACQETIDDYPSHKRGIKTLGSAIDGYMRRQGYWQAGGSSGKGSSPQEAKLLLFSKQDDRFDLITLECDGRIAERH